MIPLISVILPVYNGSAYLNKAIESIILQSYKNWELIIVDDHSTDSTPEIIKKYKEKDARIGSVTNDKNLKLPQALNTGFSLAKGNLYTWTSDDNVYLQNAFETMVHEICENKCDIVYCRENIIDENGKIIDRPDVVAAIGEPDEIPILSCVGACFLMKKEVHLDLNGYDTDKFLVEDWDFWLRAYNEGYIFRKIDKVCYLYRHNSKSLTSNRNSEIQRKCIKLSLYNLEHNKSNYPDKIVMRSYLKCVGSAYRINDKKIAELCLKYAEEIDNSAFNYLKQEIKEWMVKK